MNRFSKRSVLTDGQIAFVIIVVLCVVLSVAFKTGSLSTREQHVQHGREMERRQILSELRHGMEDDLPFYLSGMDVRFIPVPGTKAVAIRLRTSKYYRYCEGCHVGA